MSDRDMGLTRVQPVFDALRDQAADGHPWLRGLWEMAALTREAVAVPPPAEMGTLPTSEMRSDRDARQGAVYQRAVAPPAAFLRWLLDNPQMMEVRDPSNFGAKSADAQRWRGKLFSDDERLVSEARDEGLRQFGKRLAQRGRRKWWAFEGFLRVDCCLSTEACVLFVEDRPTEPVPPSTLWFPSRSRVWRNVEAAKEFAGDRAFGVILAVDEEADGVAALAHATNTLAGSYPHLDGAPRADLARHFLGFVTWTEIVATFGLPPECLTERPSPVA